MSTLKGLAALVTGTSPGTGAVIAATCAGPAGSPHPAYRARPWAVRGPRAQNQPNRQRVKET